MSVVDLQARAREKAQQPPTPSAKTFAVYFKETPESQTQVKVVEGYIANLVPLIISAKAEMTDSNVAEFILPFEKLVYLEAVKADQEAAS